MIFLNHFNMLVSHSFLAFILSLSISFHILAYSFVLYLFLSSIYYLWLYSIMVFSSYILCSFNHLYYPMLLSSPVYSYILCVEGEKRKFVIGKSTRSTYLVYHDPRQNITWEELFIIVITLKESS